MIIAIVFVLVVMGFHRYNPEYVRSLNDGTVSKSFWRKDHDTVVKYHIRDYRVPWREQLLAAIAIARKHGEQLYLEDTSPTIYARNRGNVKTVDLSETGLEVLRRNSDFFTEHGIDLATTHFDKALETADCVVICPIMTRDEQSGKVVPVANTCFPFGVTTKHRTRDGKDFMLWYPAVTTDQHGLICLPVYREMTAELALEAVDADGSRLTVETFGLRDIAKPYRFGLYDPVVLSGKQLSQLTNLPGYEEELRYVKRRVFANLALDDTTALDHLGIVFEKPNRLQSVKGGILMPTLRYADEFGDLYFRGLTRTELTRQLRQYNGDHIGHFPPLTMTDGDNFIVVRADGRTFLCRFLVTNPPLHYGLLDVWDLGFIQW